MLVRAALLGLVVVAAAGCSERSGHDPFALMEGEGIYKAECAACHGVRLAGQPDGQTPRAEGQVLAPPLDGSGTAWQRPREQLAVSVKQGLLSPQAASAPVAVQHAFADKLSDRQIDNVLAWIETQWPPEVLRQRAQRLQQP